jgi:hypothetical protein
MTDPRTARPTETFLPSKRYALGLGAAVLAALGLALYLRYGVIQNTPIGLACEAGEAGEDSLLCSARLGVILLFVWSAFGWTALAAAIVQLIRPNRFTLAIGLVAGASGLVLYNLRLSALAVPLLLLSLARAAPGGSAVSETQSGTSRMPAHEER